MESLVYQITQAVARGVLPPASSIQRNTIGSLVIAAFAALFVIFLVMTCWFAADVNYGPVAASAITAVGSLVLALIAWGIVAILNKRAREEAEAERRARATVANAQLAASAMGPLFSMVRSSPITTAAAVAALAFALVKSRD